MAAPKRVAPYGEWESAISVQAATAGSKSFISPRACPTTGRAFFLESRANGSNGIVEILSGKSLRQVLPEPFGARTDVYSYGGLPYAVLPPAGKGSSLRIIFSDALDHSLNVLDADAGTVRTLARSRTLLWSDFHPHPDPARGLVLAMQEDHEKPAPADVRNYVVLIDVGTGEVQRLVEGADFYSYPRFSPDGKKVSWREWNHPGLPFLGVKLCWADVGGDGALSEKKIVAGADAGSVGECNWGPDGSLFFTQERDGSNFRQLYRLKPGGEIRQVKLKGLEEVEIGDASWVVGMQTFVFLTEKTMVATYTRYGEYHLIHTNLDTGASTRLEIGLVDMRFDPLAALSPSSFIVIGSGYTTPAAVYRVDLSPDITPAITQVVGSTDAVFPAEVFSTPNHIQLTSRGAPQRPVHGFLWPPHNPRFAAPEGALPPLIIEPHGGPTGHSTPGLKMLVQFWTSRGFAFFAINYTGSSAHGRRYREALYRAWGILDRDDVPECVDHLAATGRIDRARVGIAGRSAGGYNVLQSLVWHPDTFAAGVCLCGVSNTVTLQGGTHKLESHYLETLLYAPGMTEEEKARIDYERSPVHHAGRIKAPLLLVHGELDPVVPIGQSLEIRRKVQEKGGVVKMVVLSGEGHAFKKEKSVIETLEREMEWWTKYLVRR